MQQRQGAYLLNIRASIERGNRLEESLAQTSGTMPYSDSMLISVLHDHLQDYEIQRDSQKEESLDKWVEEAGKPWPFSVPEVPFVAHIARCIEKAKPQDSTQPWEKLAGKDLYLAFGCLQGIDAAATALKNEHGRDLDAAVAKMRLAAAQVDDIKQQVWMRLLTPTIKGGEPKIALYAGTSPLKYWLKSVAARTALNELRKRDREIAVEDDKLLSKVSNESEDPELAFLKDHYRAHFRTAFHQAIGTLEAKNKTLLRYHHIDGLTIDEIGKLYKVHRVTAYRWLEKARISLGSTVEKILRDKLQVDDRDFDSILRLVRSQLALSITRHLRDTPASGS